MAMKVSISAIRLRAGHIAAKTGKKPQDVESDLIKAHEKVGIEIDFDPPTTNGRMPLDFTHASPERTWTEPLPRTSS